MRPVHTFFIAIVGLLPAIGAAAQAARVEPILGGRSATGAEILGTVGVLDVATLSVVCTGTLITPRVVVTAGHCFFDEDFVAIPATSYVVAFGVIDLNTPPDAAHRIAVASGGPHPEYGRGPIGDETPAGLDPTENDIGVLLLARDLVEMAPVALTSSAESDSLTEVGAIVSLVGYGVTDLDTLAYGVLMRATSTVIATIPNELLIAPANPTQGDTCFGDSGGPVYGTLDGHPVLLGLTSRGRLDSQVECGAGGIYTDVAFHRAFLAEVTGDESLAPPPRRSSGRCSVAFDGSGAEASFATVVAALALLARRRGRRLRDW